MRTNWHTLMPCGRVCIPKGKLIIHALQDCAWIWHSSGQVSEFAPPNRLFALAPAYQDQTQNNQLSITQLEWQLWTCHDDRTSRSRFVNTFLWEIALSIQFYTSIRVHILGIHTGSDVVSWSKSYVSTFSYKTPVAMPSRALAIARSVEGEWS